MAKAQKTQKERFIEEIVALLSAADISAQDLLLVKKPTLVGFLSPKTPYQNSLGHSLNPNPL